LKQFEYTPILNSPYVTLVPDRTFNRLPGTQAVAISMPGIYEVNFGVAVSSDSYFVLTVNGTPQLGGNIAINGNVDGSLIGITTLVSIDQTLIDNGQRGAALLEIINPTGVPESIGSAPNTVSAYIDVFSIAPIGS
jgi:hypothetical protein